MKNTDQIIKRINELPENKVLEVKEFIDHLSTDTSEVGSNEHSPKVQKLEPNLELAEYFKVDSYGDSKLLELMQEHNWKEIKNAFGTNSDSELLKQILVDVVDDNYRKTHDIESSVARSIFLEAREQLNLMGVDITSYDDFSLLDC